MSKKVDLPLMGTEILPKGDLNVKNLLKSGYFGGLPVQYKKGEAELNGFIKDQGYLCGCSSCNFSKVVSALKFELHAGAVSSNQNNYIFLSSGISLYALVKKLESTPIQSLRNAIEEHICLLPVSECSTDTEKIDTSVQSDCRSGPESESDTHDLPTVQNEWTPNDRSSKTSDKTVSFLESGFGIESEPCTHQLPFVQDDQSSSKTIDKTVGFLECGSGLDFESSNRLQLQLVDYEQIPIYLEEGKRKKTAALRRMAFLKLEEGEELIYISNGTEYLKGYKTENGIFCYCCKEVVSPSKFEAHAGFASRRQPYYNIYTSDRVSLEKLASSCTEFELEHYYKLAITSAKDKPNKCKLDLPKELGGCAICKGSTFETGDEFTATSFVFCGQCERVYHVGCLEDDLQERPSPWYAWLCSVDCKEVNLHLKHLVHSSPHGDGVVKWVLLNGALSKTDEDEVMFSKATSILTEAFGEITVNGNDVLPAMVEGGVISKLHFGGMHCVVVTWNSEVVSCGVFRVFGRELAELPLVATDRGFRGEGYFRWLVDVVEKLMVTMKVKSLVVCVDEEKQTLWMDRFGFVRMSEEKARRYVEDYWMIRFKKKVMLAKSLISPDSV